ncbi:hypothetical protein [Pedobacter sp. BG31]|uniref:hypothetical protein n=1 Tax=Pedobacter sp. BG31 TaxID=3349697 RepID=UPI00366F4DBC
MGYILPNAHLFWLRPVLAKQAIFADNRNQGMEINQVFGHKEDQVHAKGKEKSIK